MNAMDKKNPKKGGQANEVLCHVTADWYIRLLPDANAGVPELTHKGKQEPMVLFIKRFSLSPLQFRSIRAPHAN